MNNTSQEKPIEAEFKLLEDRGIENTLECPRCGCVFDVNALTHENLIWAKTKMADIAKCPLCGTQQL